MSPVFPGATIGILGGGQLGRMTALAARAMGYRVHVLDPDPACAARPVVERCVTAPFADAGDAPREDPLATGDVEGTLRQAVLREMGAQREAGYVYVDPGTGAYRPTWKGAALMTWRLLWPMKTIARARLRRRASALVAALNV